MTSPPERITVRCPACGATYEDWHRASINLDLDDFPDEYVDAATSATCPACGHVVAIPALVVTGRTWQVR
jgi:endogenous inhibitor of DNA gyrase (YacG/DUF329 family)